MACMPRTSGCWASLMKPKVILPRDRLPKVLKFEAHAATGVPTGPLNGLDAIYQKLRPFLLRWRQAAAETPGLRPYILATDVSRAFDSVQVCSHLIPSAANERVCLQAHAELAPGGGRDTWAAPLHPGHDCQPCV